MRTFLLLAGRSTRFWPLQEKTLFPVCGKTLLEHQIMRLSEAGCTDIVLVGGAHNIEEACAIVPGSKTVEQEDLTLGMRGAVLSILKAYPDDPLMIVSGNDVIEPGGYAALLATKSDGALLGYHVDQYFPGGYLCVDGNRITGIVEKPGEGNEPSDLVNIVAHVHTDPKALLEALSDVDASRDDGYEQALSKLLSSHVYDVVPYQGKWQAVKYPWHLLAVSDLLLSEIRGQNIANDVEIHPSAVITGDVVIEEGTKILPHATIVGPAYIGKRCIVANNALVRQASIGDDCIAGFCTEVKGSVLHSHVWTHMNYVGDSVIGHNVSFGAGTVTGNLRLDEEEVLCVVKGEATHTQRTKLGAIIGSHCRLGIHVSINPGITIGSHSFISTQTLVSKDIPEESFVQMKEGVLDIRANRTKATTPDDREQFRKKL